MIVNSGKSSSLKSQCGGGSASALTSGRRCELLDETTKTGQSSSSPSSTHHRNSFSHPSQSAKRLSLIDRGKSWAKQLMKMNKLANLTVTQQASFESCDSGIDSSSSSSSSTASSIKYSASNSSNSSKLSTSSSCSFAAVTNVTSSTNAATTSTTVNHQPDRAVYDPFYSSTNSSSTSSSKASSAAYLISPLDESGYLVPIMSFSDGTSTGGGGGGGQLTNSKSIQSAITSSGSHLTRSFSTRSAYNSASARGACGSSNLTKARFNFKNRATICENIATSGSCDNFVEATAVIEFRTCHKCNERVQVDSVPLISNNANFDKSIETSISQQQSTNSESSSLSSSTSSSTSEPFTCNACSSKSTPACSNTTSTSTAKTPEDLKADCESNRQNEPSKNPTLLHQQQTSSIPPPPLHPAPLAPVQQQQQQTPPPLPLVPPPPLLSKHLSQGTSNLQLAPLIITAAEQHHKTTSLLNSRSQHHICCCSCNVCLLGLGYLATSGQKQPSNTYKNDVNYVKDPLLSLKKTATRGLSNKSAPTDEPIAYIDSQDLDDNNNNNNNNKNSNSNESNSKSIMNSMNSLIAKLRSKQHYQQQQMDGMSSQAHLRYNSSCSSCPYCVIRQQLPIPADRSTVMRDQQLAKQLLREQEIAFVSKQHERDESPTNSVGSFEFINTTATTNRNDVDVTAIASYEKSWETSGATAPIILLENNNRGNNKPVSAKSSSNFTTTRSSNCKENSNHLIKLIGRHQLLGSSNGNQSNRLNRPSSLLLFDNNWSQQSAAVNDVDFVRAYLDKCKQQQDSRKLVISTTNSKASHANNNIKNSTIASLSSASATVSNNNNKYNHFEQQSSAPLNDNNTNSKNNSNTTNNHKQQITNSEEFEKLLSASFNNETATLTNCLIINQNTGQFERSPQNEFDTLNNDEIDLESLAEPWYQPHMPREDVQGFLNDQEIGSFLIRLSSSCRNCYALSIRVPYFANQHGVAHYLITRNAKRGYKLKGVDKEFKTLRSLVVHLSVMQEILPVTLNLTSGGSVTVPNNSTSQVNRQHLHHQHQDNSRVVPQQITSGNLNSGSSCFLSSNPIQNVSSCLIK